MSAPGASRQRLLAHLAMLGFAVLVAGSFTTGAMAVPYLAPVPLNAVRFLLAALLMGVATYGGRRAFALPPAPWRFGVLGVLMAVYFVTMFIALEITLPVATSAVFTLLPLMTAVTGFLIAGQRASGAVLASVAIAGAGSLWVIFRGDPAALLGFDIGAGEMMFFVGCVTYALYTPLLRRFSRGEPAMVLSFWTLVATALCIGLVGLPELLAVDWLHLPALVWWVVLYLAIGPTALSFFLIQYASLHLPAAKVIAYGYLTPAVVIGLEALAGHGLPTPTVLAGALAIILGLVVLAMVRD